MKNILLLIFLTFFSASIAHAQSDGMVNKIYWTGTDPDQGADKMLYYFLVHPSETAGKMAFDRFRSDSNWQQVRKDSETKAGGLLTTKVESLYLYPTDFSPLK